MSERKRLNTIIVGAAGRDFHNFNMVYRGNPMYNVVAFTAAQIPNISGRRYPAALAGKLYPKGIPIHEEVDLEELIRKFDVREVVFSYSDVSYNHVMHIGARAMAAGARYKILSAAETMLKSRKPVISVCAVRTGSGKSQTCRRISKLLREMGLKVVVVRHPMPYSNLERQVVQRFETLADLSKHNCTIEEIEEYEPHIVNGTVVYGGVEYHAILAQAEKEADIILWDGGNNDLPFYRPDFHIVVADPLRAGHELSYFPSETNLRLADLVIINKVDSASAEAVDRLIQNIRRVNGTARIIKAASPLQVKQPEMIRGKKTLVVEDGPTLTHGEMKCGAGALAARKFGAAELVDPRPYAVGEIKKAFKAYPHIGAALPAVGYSAKQIADLETTINKTPCDVVIVGTPIDLKRIITIKHPSVRVTYELEELGKPSLKSLLERFWQTLPQHKREKKLTRCRR